ncbi:GumC family protein [Aquimarina muelleri]|uniref:GumC family protein n=1 Tax=Aquimarina muelleri TaxID=279356 RepID=UPI000410C34C|nr:polysaccharide biosynthesis tyrosine autokinase [Aquimarina muelleri]MCX2762068.1 polysaccharide biosynthesis tyrosine autokinase [Aquimarina muelleri]
MDYEYQKEQSNLHLKDQIIRYLSYWKLFLITGIVCLILAILYLKYTPVQYKVNATILIKSEKSGMLSELSAFEDLSIVKNNNKEVENEIEILKSRPLFKNVVKKLNLNYQYFAKTKFSKRLVELYDNTPIKIIFKEDSLIVDPFANFIISIHSKNDFTITEEGYDSIKNGVFGQVISTRIGSLIINPNPDYLDSFIENEIFLSIKPVMDIVEDYKSRVSIGLVHQDANVISLSLNTTVKAKAKDILNGLVEEYNIDAANDKNQIYENTASFIKERLSIINTELSDIEQGVEVFKTSHNLTNVTSETELFLERSSENKKGVLETNTQLGLVDFMNEYLKENKESLLPVNLGFSEESIIRIIAQYNETALRRDEVLKSTTLKNPIVIRLNEKLQSLKLSLKQSLDNQKKTLKIKLKDLQRQDSVMNAKIASLPKKERELRDIVRQQEIKETLYLYLLQKREETAISLAATVSSAKVIEKAYSSKNPIKPKKRIVLLAAFMAAFLIPIMILFFKDLLDVKIKDKKEIQKKLDIPIVAEIPNTNTKGNFIIAKDDRSIVAEAFRIFESNLKFLLSESNNQTKTILVTSSITGEGKSFISANLSIILADPDKKVALLGLDLRSPKILEYLNLESAKGITNYVSDKNLNLEDIIINLDNIPNLDIINSGIIPPNPIDILKSKRLQELFVKLKSQYDYIIIDTPPINLVADPLLLADYVDLCIYVVRLGYSDRELLSVPENLYKNKRFSNISILLNDVNINSKKYYGSPYGYGYSKPKSWWKF